MIRLMLLTLVVLITSPALARITVTADFEGGSVRVHDIDQDNAVLRVSPGENPDRGWPCWWYFKVDGLTPGSTLTIELTNEGPGGGRGLWAMPQRAAWSSDRKTWQQTAPGEREGKAIIYRHKVEAPTLWFAWGPPFVVSDAHELVKRLDHASKQADDFTLAKSRAGHDVPALKVRGGDRDDNHRFGIWVQARQHAWESGASWVGRGFAQWLVSDDEDATWLREHAKIYFVPVMDVDNVFRGAGGKEQKPQDHNRDWSADPHWPEVEAAQQKIREMDQRRDFDLFIDLHNPGPSDRAPYFYLPPPEYQKDPSLYDRFVAAAAAHITGPLKLAEKQRISGANYDKNWQKISKNWVSQNVKGEHVAVTLETSWNTEHSTAEGYMTVGRQLGEAMAAYFRDLSR